MQLNFFDLVEKPQALHNDDSDLIGLGVGCRLT